MFYVAAVVEKELKLRFECSKIIVQIVRTTRRCKLTGFFV